MSDAQATTTLESAVKLHQAGQTDKAAAAYRRILETNPDDPNALHLLGVTFIQTAQPDEAARLIERAIALDRQGRNDDGAVEYEKALDLTKEQVARDPQNGQAQMLLARLYQQAGKLTEATAAYRAATTLLPSNPTVFYALGQVLQKEG